MKAFISYSHQDAAMLDILHKHLAQLKRDNIINTWTDQEITAGKRLNQAISSSLSTSNLFIALLSHEYIASRYCYETEFEKAQEMEQQGKIIIVPIIVEPCDWLNTPFKNFKALPKDGKAITTWENKNTAFLDVVQGLRKLIEYGDITEPSKEAKQSIVPLSRNYRVQKDFDSIAKIEFIETTLREIKELLKRFMVELEQLDNTKTRVIVDSNDTFESLLSNRNKIGAESKLTVSTTAANSMFNPRSNEKQVAYSIDTNNRPSQKTFQLAWDEYHLYWTDNHYYSGARNSTELDAKSIAEHIWNEWLQSVGIL